MPLCGSSFCGCALTSVPADFAEIDGAFPTIDVAGNGTGSSPWNLTLNDEWAAAVADRINPMGLTPYPIAAADTLQQSANITFTTTPQRSHYQVVDGVCYAHFHATLTSGGSSGTALSLLLPFPAAITYGGGGSFLYLDQGVQYLAGAVEIFDVNRCRFMISGAGLPLGGTFAAASTDTIQATFAYPVA